MSLERILWDLLVLFGDWRDLVSFLPRYLKLYAEDEWQLNDLLFYKLLLAARPELDVPPPGLPPGLFEAPMPDDMRHGIFQFMRIVAYDDLCRYDYDAYRRGLSVPETVTFLAAYDVPLAPFLQQWRDSKNARARGNLCAFLADYTLNNSLEHLY